MDGNKTNNKQANPDWWKGLKGHGIDRVQLNGYKPPYVDLDGWKLGIYAPAHRKVGGKRTNSPEFIQKPGENLNDGDNKYHLSKRPYNRHSTIDWIAKQFKGLRKQSRNYTTSLFHYKKTKGITMSKIANIQQRRRKVAQLLLEGGYSQREMADIIGVSAPTINRDIQVLDKVWRQEMAESVDTYRNRCIKRLEYVLRESKEAWERSKLPKKKEKRKLSGNKGTKNKNKAEEEVTMSTEERVGDPRFLENFKESAVDIALFQGVDRQQLTKFEINILPPLPEDKFGRYGIGDADYEDVTDQDLDEVKVEMDKKSRHQQSLESFRLKAHVEDVDFEDEEE